MKKNILLSFAVCLMLIQPISASAEAGTMNRSTATGYQTNNNSAYNNGANNAGMNANNFLAAADATDNGDNMDWGWLGLLGLIGMAGIFGRNRERERTK